ncbi:LysR family transcriptional regulator [Shewanella litorisediminis]|uniref:LysR family transcriptional regulator n=1 Tax=Shewanella litorisediminis TaxID=1173586 RepID=A0ABX7G6D6_9GAMM|nr:LysR family transcriptional regulator [Shewanella litorisediminis]MCL2917649.1 LysR family transcriptional regulator [Shewanella litorisediminis]QRH02772.1 LysR family transcriptional regulator [Shewanella litorisediminis]
MREHPGSELELIYLFVQLVDAGSLSAVADRLSMPVATVSRKLSRLEENRGRQLLMRSTRKIRLTEEGMALYERYKSLVSAVDALYGDGEDPLEGTLRIAAPISIISMIFMKTINEFRREYPGIRLHITQKNEVVDLIDKGIDIAIVGGIQPDSSWIAVPLGTLDYRLVASPGYLQRRGMPGHPSNLAAHDIIKVWPLYNWSLRHPQGEAFYYDGPASLTLTDLQGAISACVDDGGILYGPELFFKQELQRGLLLPVLPQWRGETRRISILCHQRQQQPAKVKAFIDFMKARAPGLFAMDA